MKKIEDDEMIVLALQWFSRMRHSFANDISKNTYRKKDGSVPTEEDVSHAIYMAKRCDEVLAKLIT